MQLSVDDEWDAFLENESDYDNDDNLPKQNNKLEFNTQLTDETPVSTPLTISTKSLEILLNLPVDLDIFWDIPLLPYHLPKCGVVQKQTRYCAQTPEELENVQEKLAKYSYVTQKVKVHIDNPTSTKIIFKDTRKITIGISEKCVNSYNKNIKLNKKTPKDLATTEPKEEGFFNCFVLIVRVFIFAIFREFHVKVFKTGKIVVPGIQEDFMFTVVVNYVMSILSKYIPDIAIANDPTITLINSGFSCKYLISRTILTSILRNKYKLLGDEDQNCYQGIKFRYFYYLDLLPHEQTGQQRATLKTAKKTAKTKNSDPNVRIVSFMIFRTGSVLIMGKCDEIILNVVYNFIVNILQVEYTEINQGLLENSANLADKTKNKVRKTRKRMINVDL